MNVIQVLRKTLHNLVRRSGLWLVLGFTLALLATAIPQAFAQRSGTEIARDTSSVPQTVRQSVQPTLQQQLDTWRSHYRQGELDRARRLLITLRDRPNLPPLANAQLHHYLALTEMKAGQWQAARVALDRAQIPDSPPALQAALLTARSKLDFALGNRRHAYDRARNATELYRRLGDNTGATWSALNQAQILRSLGFARRSCETVLDVLDAGIWRCEALETAPMTNLEAAIAQHANPALKAALWQGLGNGLQAIGQVDRATSALQRSLAIADRNALTTASVLLDLSQSHLAAARRAIGRNIKNERDAQLDRAQQALDRALDLAATPNQRLRAHLTRLDWLAAIEESEDEALRESNETFRVPIADILNQLDTLPPSLTTVNARVKLACWTLRCDLKLSDSVRVTDTLSLTAIRQQLDRAQATAEGLDESSGETQRSLAYIEAARAKLDAANSVSRDRVDADLQRAIALADTANLPELSYRLHWQRGNWLASTDRDAALSAYEVALDRLQQVQSDLRALDPDRFFSFRQRVEPVYRDYVDFLLQLSPEPETLSQRELEQAMAAIEALQVAEINDFFGLACLETDRANITDLDADAAVIYAILPQPLEQSQRLEQPQRLELIVNFADGDKKRYRVEVQEELDFFLRLLRTSLREDFDWETPLQNAYSQLIAPLEADLEKRNVSQLVFVLDGALRSIPMAALYDGDRFLIERYAIAIAPSLQLLAPKRLQALDLRVLAAGQETFDRVDLSNIPLEGNFDDRSNFNINLQYVGEELDSIDTAVPTRQLFESRFTAENLTRWVDSLDYPLLHIATHGRFSNFAEDTFVLADRPIRLAELAQILEIDDPSGRRDLDLVVLSACQTAQESDRAVLGMAGIAIRSGVRSIIGSLWNVNDRSTALLMQAFYEQLQQQAQRGEFNKAEALRQAQQAAIRGDFSETFRSPFFWAPFVLVGNWL